METNYLMKIYPNTVNQDNDIDSEMDDLYNEPYLDYSYESGISVLSPFSFSTLIHKKVTKIIQSPSDNINYDSMFETLCMNVLSRMFDKSYSLSFQSFRNNSVFRDMYLSDQSDIIASPKDSSRENSVCVDMSYSEEGILFTFNNFIIN